MCIRDRMCMIRLHGKFSKIINVYTLTEESMDMFYDTLQQMCDKLSKHDLIVLGDFNAKIEQQEQFEKVGGKQFTSDSKPEW